MSEKTIKTITGEMFGECQALISKAGNPYLKGTILHEDEDGCRIFVNACFFPSQDDLQKMRALLCKGRIVEATGAYSEREYVGKDGSNKIAHDLLVHDVKIGKIAEWDGEKKNTGFSLMDGVSVPKQCVNGSPKAVKEPKTTVITTDAERDEFLQGIDL